MQPSIRCWYWWAINIINMKMMVMNRFWARTFVFRQFFYISRNLNRLILGLRVCFTHKIENTPILRDISKNLKKSKHFKVFTPPKLAQGLRGQKLRIDILEYPKTTSENFINFGVLSSKIISQLELHNMFKGFINWFYMLQPVS